VALSTQQSALSSEHREQQLVGKSFNSGRHLAAVVVREVSLGASSFTIVALAER